jgi:nicotinamide riboside kinase
MKSDFYIVMNDQIPFEADPLRYGGDKRESQTQFWIELLEEFDCAYAVVTNTDLHKQRSEVATQVIKMFESRTSSITNYKR